MTLTPPMMDFAAGFIAGEWVDARDGRGIDVVNPATGERLASVPHMGADETRRAIEAAVRSLEHTPDLAARKAWLATIADAMIEHHSGLARLITLEQGKPLGEGEAEVTYAASFFRYYAEHVDAIATRKLPEKERGLAWSIHHRPAGVAGLITPWNFPLAMLAKKLAPALAAGCAVVIKPAELTPLSAMRLAALCQSAGIDAGRVNLVLGDAPAIGQMLCSHPAVRVISFTGSTRVGRLLAEQAAPHFKRLSLELGGNAPFIVFDDADLGVAADALVASKFRASGQTCVCANRVLVHEAVHDAFIRQLRPRIERLRVGNGLDMETDVGPLINRAGWDKVDAHVRDAIAGGAARLVGAETPRPAADFAAYYAPTLLVGVTDDMLVCREETFGPVVAVATFRTDDEAVQRANATPYGLAAYVMTGSRQRATRVISQLHFGHVGLNTGSGPAAHAPFGGMKASGYGREGGEAGLAEFVEHQVVADEEERLP